MSCIKKDSLEDIQHDWTDCGKYYWDGLFNIVEFPKGMEFYHGSGLLAKYNIVLPFGRNSNYFNRETQIDKNKINGMTQIQLKQYYETFKDKHVDPIFLSHDISVALKYSGKSTDGKHKLKCKNCVFAFKLLENSKFIVLTDAYNLYKIYAMKDEFGLNEEEIKSMLSDYHLNTDLLEDPLKHCVEPKCTNMTNKYILKFNRTSPRKTEYVFLAKMTNILKTYNKGQYAGVFHNYTYKKKKKLPRWAEIITATPFKYFKRDYHDKHDWQYRVKADPPIKAVISQMEKYKTFNIKYHSGNLYEHSNWVALFLEQTVFHPQTIKITKYLFPDITDKRMKTLFDTVVLAGFLHDIGKSCDLDYYYYDKEKHAEFGGDLILGIKPCVLKEKSKENGKCACVQKININSILKKYGMDEYNIKLIALLIYGHHIFGNLMKNTEQSKIPHLYINKIKHLAKKIFKNTISDNDIAFMILCSIKLSFADVKGANPFPNEEVTYNKEYEMKNKKGKFSFIANTGKIHSGSSISPFVKFKYDTEGMKIIKRILRKILPAKLT